MSLDLAGITQRAALLSDALLAKPSGATVAADLRWTTLGDLVPGTNVRDYGATGDGVTNDSAAIAAAIAAADAGGIVTVPPGAYKISTVCPVAQEVTILARGATFLTTNTAFRVDASNVTWVDATFTTTQSFGGALVNKTVAGSYRNWRFYDCVFDNVAIDITRIGRTLNDGSTATSGTDLVGGCQILGCEFKNYAQNYTIEIGGQTDTRVEGCWIHDCGIDINAGDGIKVLAGSIGTLIAHNVIEDCTRDPIDIYDSSQNTVIGNVFRRCGGDGIDAKWRAADANATDQNIVIGNRIEDMGGSGFDIDVDNALVVGNVALRCQNGFRAAQEVESPFAATSRVIFLGNQAIDCIGYGIVASNGTNFVFANNVCQGGGGFGIGLGASTSGFVIVGNVCVGNVSADLSINGTNHWVAGNQTDDATWRRKMLTDEVEIDGALNHDGTTVGFYGTAPVAKQTGVPVTAAGIHAALVNLGLITA